MVMMVGISNALHRSENEFSCLFWFNIRLQVVLIRWLQEREREIINNYNAGSFDRGRHAVVIVLV